MTFNSAVLICLDNAPIEVFCCHGDEEGCNWALTPACPPASASASLRLSQGVASCGRDVSLRDAAALARW